MKQFKHRQQAASDVPPAVRSMLRKRYLTVTRSFQRDQRDAEKAARASRLRLHLREKLGFAIAKQFELGDVAGQIEALRRRA